jgi:acyl dehydratase
VTLKLILDEDPITSHDLKRFAVASGDSNEIHLDPEVAKQAGLDDVIVHGMLNMAKLGRLVTHLVPMSRLHSLRARFHAMTPVGVAPKYVGRVGERDPMTGLAEVSLLGYLGDGTVILSGDAEVTLESAQPQMPPQEPVMMHPRVLI